jgi:membrane protein required for colicin V production
MTGFDYAVLAVLGASLLLGLWRGLISELLAIAAWLVAFVLARAIGHSAGRAMAKWIPDPAMSLVVGFALVFVGILFVAALVRLAARHLIAGVGLRPTDRFLGGMFGLGRAVVIVLAAVVVGGLTGLPRESWWRAAVLAPPLETAVIAMKPWMPEGLAKRLNYR